MALNNRDLPERLIRHMDEIVRVNPMMHLATVSPEGRPHSATVWFAPSDDLKYLYWLSSPLRTHSEHIDVSNETRGRAYVAGSMCVSQVVSEPVVGVSFEAYARRIDRHSNDWHWQGQALAAFADHNVFTEEEIDKYLDPYNKHVDEDRSVPLHEIYSAQVKQYTDFDGTLPHPENRLIVPNVAHAYS